MRDGPERADRGHPGSAISADVCDKVVVRGLTAEPTATVSSVAPRSTWWCVAVYGG
jgi:hypothetical protein